MLSTNEVRGVVVAIISIVIGIVVITNLAPTVIENTQSNAFNTTGLDNPEGALINASSSAKTMYSLIELVYAIMGVVFMVTVGFAISRKYK